MMFDVKKIANLIKIHLTDEDVIKFQNDLDSIMNWEESLQEVNVDNVEPLFNCLIDNKEVFIKKADIIDNISIISNDVHFTEYLNEANFFVVPKIKN